MTIKRISAVQTVKVNSVLFSATFHVGDSIVVNPKSEVLAVYREIPTYKGSEGDDAEDRYPVFSRQVLLPPITERLQMTVLHSNPFIQVNHLNIKGMSTAAVAQIGSNLKIACENRTKHIRHLFPRP